MHIQEHIPTNEADKFEINSIGLVDDSCDVKLTDDFVKLERRAIANDLA